MTDREFSRMSLKEMAIVRRGYNDRFDGQMLIAGWQVSTLMSAFSSAPVSVEELLPGLFENKHITGPKLDDDPAAIDARIKAKFPHHFKEED